MRNYTVVHPPLPPNTDTSAASLDRQKFIKNLWTAQALMRTKPIASAPKGSMQSQGIGLPTAYMAVQNHVVESRSRNREHIALYTNLWARNAWESSHIKVSKGPVISQHITLLSYEGERRLRRLCKSTRWHLPPTFPRVTIAIHPRL